MDNVTTTRRPGRTLASAPGRSPAGGGAAADAGRHGRDRWHSLAALTRQAGASRATVVLTGEDGVGREQLARDIHRRSERAAGPFVMVDCAALTVTGHEQALFGDVRLAGDAIIRLRGALERARGGTLYLHDGGELPAWLQQAAADAVARGRFRPAGRKRPVGVDVRLIVSCRAACMPATLPLLGSGAFAIDLPPLRDRREKALAVADTLVTSLNAAHHTARRLSRGSLRFLREHRWPGNFTALEAAVRRAYEQALDGELDLEAAMETEHGPGRSPDPLFATLDVDLAPADLAWIGEGASQSGRAPRD